MTDRNPTILFFDEEVALPALPELLREAEVLRKATSLANGEVLCWQGGGRRFLVKSFSRKGWFSRGCFGRACIRNEWRMLAALWRQGFRCVPRPVALIGSHTLLMEWINGVELESAAPCRRRGESAPPEAFWVELKELYCAIHKAGFVHGDVRRANILGQADGHPRLLDWATGRYQAPMGFWARQLLRSDRFSLFKIISDFHPELFSEEECQQAQPGCILRLGRFLRQTIYRGFLKHFFACFR